MVNFKEYVAPFIVPRRSTTEEIVEILEAKFREVAFSKENKKIHCGLRMSIKCITLQAVRGDIAVGYAFDPSYDSECSDDSSSE